jgi:hypothetical protein
VLSPGDSRATEALSNSGVRTSSSRSSKVGSQRHNAWRLPAEARCDEGRKAVPEPGPVAQLVSEAMESIQSLDVLVL